MKTNSLTGLFTVILILFMVSFYSCLNAVVGEGELTFATRNVTKFTKVTLDFDATIILTDSLEQTCMVSAQQNLMPVIETRIKGETLIISTNHKKIRDSKPVTIYLSVNRLSGIDLAGSGRVSGSNAIKTGNLFISVSGSGNVDLQVLCDKLETEISGSGEIILSGSSNESKIDISGSGVLKAINHNTGNCSVAISGSGEASVFPSGVLKATISGSGRVYYKGSPSDIVSSISGSGSIEKSE